MSFLFDLKYHARNPIAVVSNSDLFASHAGKNIDQRDTPLLLFLTNCVTLSHSDSFQLSLEGWQSCLPSTLLSPESSTAASLQLDLSIVVRHFKKRLFLLLDRTPSSVSNPLLVPNLKPFYFDVEYMALTFLLRRSAISELSSGGGSSSPSSLSPLAPVTELLLAFLHKCHRYHVEARAAGQGLWIYDRVRHMFDLLLKWFPWRLPSDTIGSVAALVVNPDNNNTEGGARSSSTSSKLPRSVSLPTGLMKRDVSTQSLASISSTRSLSRTPSDQHIIGEIVDIGGDQGVTAAGAAASTSARTPLGHVDLQEELFIHVLKPLAQDDVSSAENHI